MQHVIFGTLEKKLFIGCVMKFGDSVPNFKNWRIQICKNIQTNSPSVFFSLASQCFFSCPKRRCCFSCFLSLTSVAHQLRKNRWKTSQDFETYCAVHGEGIVPWAKRSRSRATVRLMTCRNLSFSQHFWIIGDFGTIWRRQSGKTCSEALYINTNTVLSRTFA